MTWQARTRWVGQWINFVLLWLGRWTAVVTMILFLGFGSLSAFPRSVQWGFVILGVTIVTVLWAVVVPFAADALILRSADREFGKLLPSCRRPFGADTDGDPSGMNAFVGMFAGPVFGAVLTVAVRTLAARLGYTPPDHHFGLVLLLPAWLGAFTWPHLGASLTSHVTVRWLSVSGFVGLAVIAWAVVTSPDAYKPGNWCAALFNLTVPLVWSLSHAIQGTLARTPGTRTSEHGAGPGRSGSDGGAGRPSPRTPGPLPAQRFAEQIPNQTSLS
jgi:hypothetical protein